MAAFAVGLTGVRSGDQVSLTIPQGLGFVTTISGTLRGSTLTLYFPDNSGNPVAIVYHRGSLTQYDQAVQTLRQRSAQATACSQAIAAAATAIAKQQQTVESANANLERALDGLAYDVNWLARDTSITDALQAYAADWATMQEDDKAMRADEAVQPFDCAQLATVKSDLAEIESDRADIQTAATSFTVTVNSLNRDIGAVQNDIDTVHAAYRQLQEAVAADTTGEPKAQFTRKDVDGAVSQAQQQIDRSTKSIRTAQAKAQEYDQKAAHLLADAEAFVNGLTC